MKKIIYSVLALFSMLLASCTGDSYLNAIPEESTALISLDLEKMNGDGKLQDKAEVLKSLFQVDDLNDCGIDLSKKLYLFTSPDGNLGFCGKVSDSGDLQDWLEKLAQKGTCKKITEKRGFHFTVLKDSWVVGFSDEALLVMGPAVGAAQDELQQTMVKYLKADEEDGIKSSPMYDKLDSIPSAMAMVAQAQALPAKFVAPFTLGAPKGTDPSQVVIAAEISAADGCLDIKGETFSFNKTVDEALKKAAKVYRPIKGTYAQAMSQNAVAGMFVNVDGKQFLPLMQTNKGIQALLAGVNSAIDMDNIIRSVDGDMSFVMSSMSDANTSMMMAAKLAHTNWLADVSYWKQSCPQGGKIADWGKNAYYYTDGKMSYYFGVTPDLQYYSGSNPDQAKSSIVKSATPISAALQKRISGQKLVMVINLSGAGKEQQALQTATTLMSPVFGKFNSIVYSLK